MAYFQVVLSGSGIALTFEENEQPVIGFYATRFVKAESSMLAEAIAKELVLSEWGAGGAYADANRGGLPLLAAESTVSVNVLTGVLKRRSKGYTFYQND